MASKARRVCRMRTQLPVVIMKEGKYFIAYAPALDYSTCGRSVEEAQRMFGKGVKIFLSECVKMGTLESVLSDCGWRKIERPVPHFVPPAFITNTQQEVEIPCHV